MPSDHEEKMVNLTRQMRHNQSDLQSFLSDLDSWETDIKKKEVQLLSENTAKDESLPPVRNTIHKKKLKKKKKEKVVDPNRKPKISGHDFRTWDKFDVDKALDEIDKEEKKDTSSSEYETDEEWEMERKLHLAGAEKEKGNNFFKSGEYDRAVEAYTKGMEFDSTNAVLPANRAMALLKQQKYAAAELDCTSSISLDPLYIKAYLRRATARANLNKHKESIEDYNRVLDLEPTNKMAQTELERLQKEKDRDEKSVIPSSLRDDERGRVKAIYKSPEERSKVPLKRIVIEEIGIETTKRNQQALTEQSELTKKITERESKNFENLLGSSKKDAPKQDMSKSPPSVSLDQDNLIRSEEKTNITTLAMKDEKVSRSEDLKPKGKSQAVSNSDVLVNGFHKSNSKESCDVSPREPSNHQEKEKIPSIPHSSFQFQTDFKLLKNKPEAFYQYFTAIPPSQYPVLFGQCLDADILKTIIKSFLDYSKGTDMNVYQVMLGLTNVKRFSMTAMFLSKKEKQSARELTEYVYSMGQCSQEELSTLRQKYDL